MMPIMMSCTPPQHHQADDDRWVARDRLAEHEGFNQDLHAEDESSDGEQEPEQARQPQRRRPRTR